MNLARHLGSFSWALAAKLLPLVYGLALILLVIPALPVAEFGRFNIIFATFNFIALLNRSLILHPMLKFAADPADSSRMTATGLAASFGFYALLGGMVWAVAGPAAAALRVAPGDIRMVALLMAAFFLRDYGFFVQQSRYRTGRLFLIEAVYFVGASGGFLAVASSGGMTDAVVVIWLLLGAALASSLTALLVGSVRFRGPAPDGESVRRILRYGLNTLPGGLAGSFFISADVLALGAVYTPVQVGVYSAAKAVYRVASALAQAAGLLVLPYASRLIGEGRRSELRELFEKSNGYIFIGLVAVAAVGWALAGPFYSGFLGGKYAESAPLLRILLAGAPFEGLFGTAGSLLYGAGFAGLVSAVSAGVLGVLVLLLLPGLYLFGVTGCAAAVVLAQVVAGAWMFTAASRRIDSGLRAVVVRLLKTIAVVLKGSRDAGQ